MGYRTKEQRTEYNKKYWKLNRERLLVDKKQYYESHKEELKEYHRKYRDKHRLDKLEYYRTHRKEFVIWHNKYRLDIKNDVLSHYGKDGKCKCVYCGYDKNIEGLTIDHINGGGRKHMSQLKRKGIAFYQWLKNNNYPEGFQTLCGTCQLLKRIKRQ